MLRLRFSILMRCATTTAANFAFSDAERKLMTDPVTCKLDDGTSVELRLPSLEFREEITHRFRALADATWIYNQHGPPWTRDELSTRLGHAAEKRIRRARKSRLDPAPKRRRTGGGEAATANFATDEDAELKAMQPDRGTAEVAAVLRAYAAKDIGTGLVAEQYRGKYMDFMICPGDDGVFSTRNPNMQASTKNVVKMCRGGRFFSAASEKASTPPHEVLAEAAERLAAEVGTGADVAMLRPDFRGAEPTEDRMNDRSRAKVLFWFFLQNLYNFPKIHEEIAALGAFDCLMKGRYNVAWRARFVVTRSTYRTAKSLGFLDKDALPVLLVSANAFEFLYEGRILRTSSVYEAMAWWLEALRLAHGGLLPASVALFKGIVAAKLEQMRGGRVGSAAEERDSDEEEGEEDGAETEPDERNMEIAAADAAIFKKYQQNSRGENEDGDVEMEEEEEADENRVVVLTEELKRKASHIDARDLCRVIIDGASSIQFRGEHRKKCELLLDGVAAVPSPSPTPATKRIIVSF